MQKTFNFFYAFLLALLGFGVTLIAEEITLTTYYPAPYGAYEELTTTGNTYLATDAAGNVGIGTTSPKKKLNIFTTAIGGGILIDGSSTVGIAFGRDGNELSAIGVAAQTGHGSRDALANDLVIRSGANSIKGRILFATNNLLDNSFPVKVIITGDGNIGIGTTDPGAYMLNVNGNTIVDRIYTRQATTAHGQGHNFNDIAEDIMAEGCEAGDVVVIDPINKEKVIRAIKPYDTSVAGIISETPAFYIGKRDQEPYLPLALAGRVLCKVSLENGPIKQGDLLTSSVTPGHAMKATDRKKIHGAIVAKALDAFEGGPNGEKIGKIMVLVTLQ